MEARILMPDCIQLLFSNVDEMLNIHSQFNNILKVKRRDSPVVGDIADVLLSMVSVCVCVCVLGGGENKNKNSKWYMEPYFSVGGYQYLSETRYQHVCGKGFHGDVKIMAPVKTAASVWKS